MSELGCLCFIRGTPDLHYILGCMLYSMLRSIRQLRAGGGGYVSNFFLFSVAGYFGGSDISEMWILRLEVASALRPGLRFVMCILCCMLVLFVTG